MREAAIPEAALRDPEATEMIRVWIAEQGLWTTLNIGVYQDTGIAEERAWGVILADTTRHIAAALQQAEGLDRQQTIKAICRHMLEELGEPTSDAEGQFQDRRN